MKPLLRVLNVEDSEDDTRLLMRELARSEYEIVHKRVETAEALSAALDQESWDILFCDFTLPRFSGQKALEIVRERDIDLPFIFVSGTIGEDVAVQAMKAGAHDYVLKNNLARLVPAMEREVVEAKVRRQRRQAEEDMRVSEYKYRRLFEILGDAAFLIDTETALIIDTNPQAEALLGRPRAEILGMKEDQLYSPQGGQQQRSASTGTLERRFEANVLRKDWRIVPVQVSVSKLELHGRHVLLALFHDLTDRKQSEQTIQEQANLLELAHDAISVRSLDEKIGYWNKGAEKLYGWTAEEAIGGNFGEMAYEDSTSFEAAKAILMQTGRWSGEVHKLTKDRLEVVVASHWTLMRDSQGRPNSILVIDTDITEKKRMESQFLRIQGLELVGTLADQTSSMHERFNELVAIVESSDDAIIGKTLEGIITSWNESARRLLGYDAVEIIGQPVSSLIPVDRLEEETDILARLRCGERIKHFETVRRHKDGSLIEVSLSISPIRDQSGRIVGAAKIARDIGERKRAEEELKASLKEVIDLKAALDQHAIVAITDQRGKITYVNDKFCAISKYSREELIGKDHRIINSGYHPKELIRELWTTIGQGKVWKGELKNKAKDGTFYWVDTTIVPFLNEENKPRQYVAIRADITERKQIEEQFRQLNADLEQRVVGRTAELEAANKELEAFSYSVSHDLRAPLRAINGFASFVLEDFSSQLPEEGRRYLERVREGGKRMGELIDDLLAFSRLNRQPVNRQTINTVAVVRDILEELKPQQIGREIELCIGNLPPCEGDPTLIKQLWVNLLSNAIKYTRGRKPAILEIGCAREDGENVYFIRDNGAGFDMQYVNKLFGVFQRLHRADEFEGTGVGLAIVQRVVHRHGGRVWAEAAVDRGATFYFSLNEKT